MEVTFRHAQNQPFIVNARGFFLFCFFFLVYAHTERQAITHTLSLPNVLFSFPFYAVAAVASLVAAVALA